jgi:hypothetical protein
MHIVWTSLILLASAAGLIRDIDRRARDEPLKRKVVNRASVLLNISAIKGNGSISSSQNAERFAVLSRPEGTLLRFHFFQALNREVCNVE